MEKGARKTNVPRACESPPVVLPLAAGKGSSLIWLQNFQVEDRVLQRNGLFGFSHDKARHSALETSPCIDSSCPQSQGCSITECVHSIDSEWLFPAQGDGTTPQGFRVGWLVLRVCRCKDNARGRCGIRNLSKLSQNNNNLKWGGVSGNCFIKTSKSPKR